MHLGVVPQRLEMADAFIYSVYRFEVQDTPLREADFIAEALPDHGLKDLALHLAHDPDLYGRAVFAPRNVEGWVFGRQHLHVGHHLVYVLFRRSLDRVAHERLR